MKRLAVAMCAVGLAVFGASSAAPGASATTLCVGGSGCFPTIQAAVDAAADGDTITVAPGTFAGGVTIDVSVTLVGAGATRTIIDGGGPVLTIGEEQADTEPTVSISGVTITGGLNDSFPDHAVTQGGGVRIPQGAFPARVGATVTISNSVITGNRVASQQLLPPGFCGPFDCSFASGGGIWNSGTLALANTRVSNNQVGDARSLTVVANAGGIANASPGTLTITHSVVTDNRAVGAPPWGDTASSAGIDSPGRLTIEDSVVSRNSAELSTDDPTDEFPIAIAGGIGIGSQAAISRTIVSDNSITAVNVGGMALAVAGGIFDEGSLTLSQSTVMRNTVRSSIPTSSQDTAFAGAGGMEVNGEATILDSRFIGNTVSATAPDGLAGAGGGGISNFGETTLERTVVTANRVDATGATGFAHGGGIENDTLFGSTPHLTLTDSVISGNAASANAGLTVQGGGLFTSFPVVLTRTVITGNKPDQCFGC